MPAYERPTSPHLTIYRKQITSVLSITHRMTGLALYAGGAVLAWWLYIVAYDPAQYESFYECVTSPLGTVAMMGWTAAFYYHLSNGIRHLFWDMGKGLDIPQVTRSGWAVIVFTIFLTVLTWGFINSLAG